MNLLAKVNEEIVANAEQEPDRFHLGGSQIGEKCLRKLLYSFRKAAKPRFNGRMYRLFSRGHEEEFRFVRWLRGAGVEVQEYSERLVYHDPSGEYTTLPWKDEVPPECIDCSQDETAITIARMKNDKLLKQWRIVGYRGHFSGSLDGKAVHPTDPIRDGYLKDSVADIVDYTTNCVIPPNTKFLIEFKTHNFKSFLKLVDAKSVKIMKPLHYAQMQVYMHYEGLEYALYCAVNKNDDDIYFEIVPYNKAAALAEVAKSETVINLRTLPDRMPGASPALFDCKFCDFKGPCHSSTPLLRSCRSCKHIEPVDDQQWFCHKWKNVVPVDFLLKGCDDYTPLID